MKERYVPIRPGISEHLLRGDLSAFEFGVYAIIHLQADFRTGIWRGSAPRILNSAPRGAELRAIQRALEQLTELGLLKHFHKQGQRGNFAFLINKFTVRSGALTGMRLNAAKSVSWQSPVYESCADDDAEGVAEGVAQDAPIQEVRRKKEEERKPRTAKTAPPADARFGPFLEFAKSSFEAKHGNQPTWDCFGKDGAALAAFLRRAPHVTLEVWTAHLTAYFDSTEAFTAKQGGSLSYFISRFDTFSSGPILGGSNGNVTSFSERRSQKSAAAINTVLGRFAKASGDIYRALPPANK
jgi:hypothetical protein